MYGWENPPEQTIHFPGVDILFTFRFLRSAGSRLQVEQQQLRGVPGVIDLSLGLGSQVSGSFREFLVTVGNLLFLKIRMLLIPIKILLG